MVKAWKAILAAVVIFLAGAVAGGMGVHLLRSKPPRVSESGAKGGLPLSGISMRIELMKRMSQRLNLVPDQRQKIEAIVTTGQQRMRQLWEPVAPQAHELLRELRKNIEAELTPAQRQTFSQLMKERPARPPGERPEWRRREGRAEEGRGPEAPSPR